MPAEPVRVHSDARALGQILINLVNNAVKFTDTGIVRVAVTGDDPAGGGRKSSDRGQRHRTGHRPR